jgi:pimeloyl-ACP methyl ester carboxylesterase
VAARALKTAKVVEGGGRRGTRTVGASLPISELDARTRALVAGSAGGDVLLRTALASVVAGTTVPWALSCDVRREKARSAFYRELSKRSTAQIFRRPKGGTEVTATRADSHRRGSARVDDLHFASTFVAVNPEVREDYAALRRNRVAWAQHWSHAAGPRPTLCVIHGFGASPYWFNSIFFSLPWLFHQGYDVLLYTMPLHGRRASLTSPLNGVEMLNHGVARVNESIFHAVHDFRVFLAYLRGNGVRKIGVTGLSLGGYTSALLAAVDPGLDVVIPNAAVSDFAPLLRSWFPSNVLLGAMRARGLSFEAIEAALSVHSPLSHASRVSRDRLMIIGGLGDRLAPPEQSLRLWEHWGQPRLHWYPGNHTVHLRRGDYLREMLAFMRASGFAPPRPRGARRGSPPAARQGGPR